MHRQVVPAAIWDCGAATSTPAPDHEQALGRLVEAFQVGHRGPSSATASGRVQVAALHPDHRAVGRLNHRQGVAVSHSRNNGAVRS